MNHLHQLHCQTYSEGSLSLSDEACQAYLKDFPHWQLGQNPKHIFREFKFDNYYQTIAFVNALAFMAHREDHHPDLEVHYDRCRVQYSTHSVKGLSLNDFICAAQLDAIFSGN